MPQAKHDIGVRQGSRSAAEKGREIPMSTTDTGALLLTTVSHGSITL